MPRATTGKLVERNILLVITKIKKKILFTGKIYRNNSFYTCKTYLATVKKTKTKQNKKKTKNKTSVQEQCNVCPLIVEDHSFLFIIMNACTV